MSVLNIYADRKVENAPTPRLPVQTARTVFTQFCYFIKGTFFLIPNNLLYINVPQWFLFNFRRVQQDISFRVDVVRTKKFFNNSSYLFSSEIIFFKINTQNKYTNAVYYLISQIRKFQSDDISFRLVMRSTKKFF